MPNPPKITNVITQIHPGENMVRKKFMKILIKNMGKSKHNAEIWKIMVNNFFKQHGKNEWNTRVKKWKAKFLEKLLSNT